MPSRPLGALSIVFGGFILLVLISQLSYHLLAQAILAYPESGAGNLPAVEHDSSVLAYSAAALGIVFSGAVLFMTKGRLDSELRIYKLTGLPARSALRIVLASHPVVPLVWALATGAAAWLVDSALGLDAEVPAALALIFAALVLAWVAGLTIWRFSQREIGRGARGRVG